MSPHSWVLQAYHFHLFSQSPSVQHVTSKGWYDSFANDAFLNCLGILIYCDAKCLQHNADSTGLGKGALPGVCTDLHGHWGCVCHMQATMIVAELAGSWGRLLTKASAPNDRGTISNYKNWGYNVLHTIYVLFVHISEIHKSYTHETW